MRVDAKRSFILVYSLCKHEYLGYLIEPHVVQLNQNGSFSLTYQRLFTNTAKEFSAQFDEQDWELIRMLEELDQSQLIKRFYKKHIRPSVYFTTIFDEKIFDVIRPKIELVLNKALPLLQKKPFFLMSKEGWPVEQRLTFAKSPCSILFHFRRSETELRYFPTLKYEDKRLEFMFKDAQIIINQPAIMLMDSTLYYFEQELDGRKLIPFLNKRYISIPKSSEHSYFKRFITPLIEKHHVFAEGFTIQTEQYKAIPLISLSNAAPQTLSLHFKYGPYVFKDGGLSKVSVKMEHDARTDSYIFHRIKRSMQWEENRAKELTALGLKKIHSLFNQFGVADLQESVDDRIRFSMVDWLYGHIDQLKESGFEIIQKEEERRFLFGKIALDLEIKEHNDWFDILAVVYFGDYAVPFIQLRNHILDHNREYVLPSGEIALIPEQWFSQFTNLFQFSVKRDSINLQKHHIGLLNDLQEHEIVGVSMRRRMQELATFNGLQEIAIPKRFKGKLRPYQQAGYNWFQFLKTYRFGGCLADDMGLGKTVQTLALLQKEKEEKEGVYAPTSLLIMPTSLIYNWLNEAERFTPDLRILNHTGINRSKSSAVFADFDVVICTYGTTRIDMEILAGFQFHYIILDESQNIKNVSSKSFKAVQGLHGRHKLILSGTPVENSVADLWPQMAFINPGLLGSHSFFMKNFVLPIERKSDEEKSRRLQALIKPFILRRTKDQVANELPRKTEKMLYCTMSEKQADYYERVKAEFRNSILAQTDEGVIKRSAVQILQGLSKLRQLANHPRMIDADYAFDSGKFESVVHHLDNVVLRGHKVLIFSQFVKQLTIYREYFDQRGLHYAYLDGSTVNRAGEVNTFKENNEVKIFLISIKAGGVGLNLTEADYVFILDPWWNPAVEMQAVDRTHRIGQTQHVFIYKFISKDTVEEKIVALQRRKKGISESLIQAEESFAKSLSAEDIHELLS